MTGTRLASVLASAARFASALLRWLLEPIGEPPPCASNRWRPVSLPPASLDRLFGAGAAAQPGSAADTARAPRSRPDRRRARLDFRKLPLPAPRRCPLDGSGFPDIVDLTTLHEPFDRPHTKGDPR